MILLGFFFILIGCGGKEMEETQAQESAAEPQMAEEPPKVEAEGKAKGEAVAKEILDVYDQAVAEITELMKGKPEAAEVKPKLEEMFQNYQGKMKALNEKYLALRDEDIVLFGAANGYMGENRGKHVFEKDKALDEYIYYYSTQKGEQELTKFINDGLFNILEIAIEH
jgi:hypothetical protein